MGARVIVRRACGLSRKAIAKGIREIAEGAVLVEGRIRRPGGGRKPKLVSLIGARGFEPPTSWSRTKRATRLRYAPTL
jgi:hypothetical protein